MSRRRVGADPPTVEIPGFEIKRTIGKGGMATAYLAVQRSPSRVVALKVLHPFGEVDGPGEDAETLVERFRNEGEILSRLDHPNIVNVYGAGHHDRAPYIYMEYVGGGDLGARIEGGLSPNEALDIVCGIGGALAFAHARGIIHRDVKPTNILFRKDDTPLLTDFGIAKQLEKSDQITTIGMLLGSPVYMSPEQAEGRTLDARTDLYSLGIILYEILVGRPPFVASSPLKVMMAHAQDPVPRLPAPLSDLQPFLDRMLAKRRDDRVPDAATMVERATALRARLAGRPETSRRAGGTGGCGVARTEGETTRISDSLRASFLEDLASDRLILPTLSPVAARIRKVVEDESASAERIADALARDSAICAQLLRIANSAYYGARGQVRTLPQAIVLLGSQAIQHIVTLVAVSQAYDASLGPALRGQLEEIWARSARVAAYSELVARRWTELDPGVAMLGGLLHNVGALPILVWAEPIPHLANDSEALARVMRRLESEVGAAILEQWQLPEDLVAIVAEYAQPRIDTRPAIDYIDVVGCAWLMVRAGDAQRFDASGWLAIPPVVKLKIGRGDLDRLYEDARPRIDDLQALKRAG